LRKNFLRNILICSMIFFVILIIMYFLLNSKSQKNYIYSEILGYFKNQQVTEYSLNLGSRDMKIKLKDGSELKYTAPSPHWIKEDIKDYIKEYNNNNPENPMKENVTPPVETPWYVSMLPVLLINLLPVILLVYLYRKSMSGFMSSEGGGSPFGLGGKSKFKALPEENLKATFAEVAGVEEEKNELQEIVEFLKSPEKYSELGAKIPKGVLLVGPPGTGKTLLARAVAGEANVPFFLISGSEFVEMFVGMGASRVRELFDQAKKNSPCIVFIDEIDAVGRQRGAGYSGGHEEREQTLNQLLVEMDGFGINEGIIIIAATNRVDVLDKALLRPGRFDRQIAVGYPDVKGREEILKVHAKGKPFAPDVVLKTIAQSTAGFTGADLANILNEAALLSARNNLKSITMKQIEEATRKVMIGTEKRSRVITEEDKRITAYHEAGHAIANYFCPNYDAVHEISIVQRGWAAGYTLSLPDDNKLHHTTKKRMEEEIIVSLGGRIAEILIMGDMTTGASSDISRVTETARDMVMKYGMSETLGPIVYNFNEDSWQGKEYSEQMAFRIDEEVRKIVASGYNKTENILKNNINKLHLIAKYLIKNEKMTGEKFKEVMENNYTEEDLLLN